MNENAKTLTFVVVAAAVVALAVVLRPSLHVAAPVKLADQPLYPDFKEPLAVANLEIVQYDEDSATVRPFQVARLELKGTTRWVIPSHDNYPADAKDQVASAAAGLMGLKPLQIVSEDQGDQQEYGVVDPDPKSLKLGAVGVGIRVVMKDQDGKELLALVIGKQVPDKTGLRYVRKVGEAPIYVVEAKTDKLTTKFENWIERNLLQIKTLDMKQLQIRDYSLKETARGLAIVNRNAMQFEYTDTATPKWKLTDDERYLRHEQNPTRGHWSPVEMAADEEVNAAKLDELEGALDDLKIVDVVVKPKGLSADLKVSGEFASTDDSQQSLQEKGFFPARLDAAGPVELYSNDGEFRVLMKDGVHYDLRFGAIAGRSEAVADKEKDKGTDADKDKEKKSGGLNRYLLVMAEFDPELIPKPQLDALPEPKTDPAPKADAEKKPEEAKPEEKKADENKAEEKKPEEKKADEQKAEDPERQRIEKENQRKQDEYDRKMADGKKHAAELNARFADWYYIISDDVYRKIHLGHSDVVKKKEPPNAGQPSGMPDKPLLPFDALDKLKNECLPSVKPEEKKEEPKVEQKQEGTNAEPKAEPKEMPKDEPKAEPKTEVKIEPKDEK